MSSRPTQPELSLSPRKRAILRSVIQHYVSEVRPVSSQALADDIHVSSATVRGELAALEELGFLRQLHTSGGRVPTDRAYRFFVEELIGRLSDTLAQRARVERVYGQLGDEMEALLEGTLDLLTTMTGQVAWITLPETGGLAIRSIAFVEMDASSVLLMLVTGTGSLHSRVVHLDAPVRELELGRLSEALNNYLRGRSIVEVDYAELKRIFRQSLNVPDQIIATMQEFFSGLAAASERVVFGNALRLVLEPEFASGESLSGVLAALQHKDEFARLLRMQLAGGELQTIIGSENLNAGLQDCSLVISRYVLPGGGEGALGVLGPTRQHYERSLSWVKVVGEAVARALEQVAGQSPSHS